MTELEERPLDRQKQNGPGGVNAQLNPHDRGKRDQRNVLSRQELRDEMDDELLHEIRAVGDAGYERDAGNGDPPEGQSRTDRANQKCGHAESDERKLPDTRRDGDHSGVLDPKGVDNKRESRNPEPGREIHQASPPLGPEFFDRGEADTEEERIETCPGAVVDPGLEGAPIDAGLSEISPGKEPAQSQPADDNGTRDDKSGAAPSNQTEQD